MRYVKILHTLLTLLTIFIASAVLLSWVQLQFLLGSGQLFDYQREFSKNFYHIYITLPFLIFFLILFQLNIIGIWHKIAKYTMIILVFLLGVVSLEVLFEGLKWNSPYVFILYLPSPVLLLCTTLILSKSITSR